MGTFLAVLESGVTGRVVVGQGAAGLRVDGARVVFRHCKSFVVDESWRQKTCAENQSLYLATYTLLNERSGGNSHEGGWSNDVKRRT